MLVVWFEFWFSVVFMGLLMFFVLCWQYRVFVVLVCGVLWLWCFALRVSCGFRVLIFVYGF